MNKTCQQCHKELKERQKKFCSLLCFNSSSSWKNTQKKKGEKNPRKGTGTFDEKEYARQYYKNNKEKLREEQLEYYLKNKERWLVNGRKWAKNNKGKIQTWCSKRRALKRNAIIESSDMEAIKKFYILAENLTIQMGEKYCVDHIKPLIKGGKHHQDNLQVITLIDNSRKGAKYPFEVANRHFPDIFFNPSPDQQSTVA